MGRVDPGTARVTAVPPLEELDTAVRMALTDQMRWDGPLNGVSSDLARRRSARRGQTKPSETGHPERESAAAARWLSSTSNRS
jgi:hypothetical protein